jgi:predicted acyl esterase
MMKKIYLILIILILLLSVNIKSSFAQDNKGHRNRPIKQYKPRIVPNALIPKAAYSVITSAFNVTLRDGVILDCSRFYPSVADPNNFPNGYPVVIMAHGYGESKAVYATDANSQAKQGFVVYTYSMRGQGFSGGLSNLISTVEAKDLIEFVNFIRHDNITRLDTSKILIEGGSQGGIIPYMASTMGDSLKLRCIISDLASPEMATTWIENGSIKMTFLWTISYDTSIARYNNLITAMRSWVYANNPAKYDSLAYWLPIGRDFKTKLSQIKVPIFIENTWQDMFFNALGNINAIPFLTAPKRFYFGAVDGHGGESSTTENNFMNQLWDEWYNYYLLNIHNNLPGRPKYYFAYSQYPLTSSKWSFVHDSSTVWPPGVMGDMKLYFNSGGKLLTTANPVDSQITLVNHVTGGLTMQQAVDYAFKGTYFNNRFSKAQLTFDSDPLLSDVKMIGNQLFNIDYTSNVNVCQFNFQIYEVNGTTSKLVTRANFTDWHNTPNIRKVKSFYGLSHSHIFKAGNKIRIVITNLDTSPNDNFLKTNPHVLPSLVDGNNTLSLNSNTFIDMHVDGLLPVELSSFTSNVISRNIKLSWVTATETNNSGFEIYRKSAQTDWMKIGFVNGSGTINTQRTYSFTDENLNTGKYSYKLKQIDYNGNSEYFTMSGIAEIGTPNKFELSQNFPNPFNPSTIIEYSIPQEGFVTLRVYDITGKEVAVLVNSHLPVRYYTVNFNADSYNLSSGIYIYKLSMADYSQVKEMLFIK